MTLTTEDLLRQWWRRLRLPLGLLVVVTQVVRSRESLGSGDPRLVVSALAWVGFWGWLLLRPLQEPLPDRPTATELRSRNRPMMFASAGWTAVAAVLVAWSVVDRGRLHPPLLVTIAIPLLLLLGSSFGHSQADKVAHRLAKRDSGRG